MKFRAVLVAAIAAVLIGSFAAANAVAAEGSQSEATSVAQAQQATPKAPVAPETATFKCPNCGAECPMPYGGRGMRGARGHDGRGMRAARGRDDRGFGQGRQSRGMRGDFGRGTGLAADRMLRRASAMELTDEQVDQLKKLSFDAKSKLIDLESELDKARLEMHQQMDTDADNLAAMKKQLESVAKIRLSIQELKLENWIDARNVLTDAQKQKVKDRFPGARMGW
jgi:Spy/CpxP family protein refolding chaperone